jgi:hypothetical protein
MREPADLAHPKDGEMPTSAQLSDDDRLKLRAIISQGESERAAVDKLKIEAGEAKTKSTLIVYARTQGLESKEIGKALEAKGLMPFNPDNWERMKDAVREYAQNRPVAA